MRLIEFGPNEICRGSVLYFPIVSIPVFEA